MCEELNVFLVRRNGNRTTWKNSTVRRENCTNMSKVLVPITCFFLSRILRVFWPKQKFNLFFELFLLIRVFLVRILRDFWPKQNIFFGQKPRKVLTKFVFWKKKHLVRILRAFRLLHKFTYGWPKNKILVGNRQSEKIIFFSFC